MRALLSRLDSLALLAAGTGLVGLMLLTAADIVGRSFHLFTIQAVVEMSLLTLALLAFLALSPSISARRHIVVDLLSAVLGSRFSAVLDRLWQVVGAVFLGLVAYGIAKEGLFKESVGETTRNLGLSLLFIYIPAAVGAALGSFSFLLLALRADQRLPAEEESHDAS